MSNYYVEDAEDIEEINNEEDFNITNCFEILNSLKCREREEENDMLSLVSVSSQAIYILLYPMKGYEPLENQAMIRLKYILGALKQEIMMIYH